MKSRETLIRLRKFQVDEKRRRTVQIETMVAEFERMCVEGHHINGAMSVTEEYGLEFLSRQALGTRLALGDPAEHKEQLLRTLEARQKEAATA